MRAASLRLRPHLPHATKLRSGVDQSSQGGDVAEWCADPQALRNMRVELARVVDGVALSKYEAGPRTIIGRRSGNDDG
jgi:hypothetical protein